MDIRSFSKYAGWVLVTLGIAGFFTGSTLLWFRVSGPLNLFHVATGILAITAGTGRGVPLLLPILGIAYSCMAVAGLVLAGDLFGYAEVNTADNFLFILAAAGFFFLGTTPRESGSIRLPSPPEPPPAQ